MTAPSVGTVWAREPAAVVAVLLAAVNTVAVFVPMSDLQRGMVIALASAVAGLLVRSQVSPVASASPVSPVAASPPVPPS